MTDTTTKQKKILLVDDDTFLLSLYANKFSAEKAVTVEAVDSVDAALTKLREGSEPDIIVFDMVMPHQDGYDLLSTLNSEGLATKAIRIALTNEMAPEQEERVRALGVEGYIIKASNIPSEVVREVLRIAESAVSPR